MIIEKGKVTKPIIGGERLQKILRGYSINRCNFLTGMITSLITATLLIAVASSLMSFLSIAHAQSSKVDVHCHIFNARDLPLEGAVKVWLKNCRLPQIAINLLIRDRILEQTPDYVKENKKLDELLHDGNYTQDFYEPSQDDFKKYLEDLNAHGHDLTKLLSIEEYNRLEGLSADEVKDKLWDSLFGRSWKWVRFLKMYRHQIASKLLSTYQDIDLFTPAFIDLDHWLPEKTETTNAEQIILYEKIIRLFKGKIHPLVAFDPLREVHYSDDIEEYSSFYWVKQAVEHRGFIGVKVYPPMGFYPINNTERMTVRDKGYKDRVKIDKALIRLYDWCIEKDVPIMAHCANSNGAQPGDGIRAKPEYWKEVLDFQDSSGNYIYRDLRLNLAHFGGADSVIDQSGWAWEIAKLMKSTDYPHVNADTGYHDIRWKKGKYKEALKALYNTYSKAKEHLMYGSDWHMIMLMSDHKEYPNKFEEIFDANFPDNVKADFFGENALQFFGLDGADTQNRRRLLAFYKKHNMTKKPKWWVGGWWVD